MNDQRLNEIEDALEGMRSESGFSADPGALPFWLLPVIQLILDKYLTPENIQALIQRFLDSLKEEAGE